MGEEPFIRFETFLFPHSLSTLLSGMKCFFVEMLMCARVCLRTRNKIMGKNNKGTRSKLNLMQ